MVPSGSGGAVHYGGACFDAMDAWKYVGGKTAVLPPGKYLKIIFEQIGYI